MLRKLLVLFALISCTPAFAQDVNLFWRAETTTLDGTHDFTVGDSTWDNVGTAVSLDSAAGMRGTNGVLVNGFAENYRLDPATIFETGQGCFGFLWRFTAWPAFTKIAMVRGSTTDYQFSVWTHGTSDTLIMYRGNDEGTNVNFQVTGLGLSTNTPYFIKACWNQATPIIRLSVYGSPTTSPSLIAENTETTSWTIFPDFTQTNGFQLGDNSGGISTENLHYDSVIVSGTYSDPIQNYAQYTSYTQIGGGGGSNTPRAMHYKRLMGRHATNDDQFLLRASR